MDRRTAERIALMSIHPAYASAILDGSKTVEFRKRRLADDIKTVVIYATSPVRRVVGTFDVGEIIEGSPAQIWARFGRRGSITKADFFHYYANAATAVAISVTNTKSFATPLALHQLKPDSTAPQSFSYLRRSELLVNA